ncbi:MULTISPECIES: hypothetical protein [Pseudomonas]|uniref:hypothetical protein n=1 Tax=Pseudomonas TaxID=286 RepID=UPI001FF4C26A|nr:MULTISPECIES: hypothetical protein [Pseudomonas]
MSDEHASDTTDSVAPEQVFIWLSAVSTFGAIRTQPSGTLAESDVLNSKTTIFIISPFMQVVRHWIDRAFGGLLVGFGILLAVARGGALTEHSRWPDLKGTALTAINA